RPLPSSGWSRCATCWAADGPGGGPRVYAWPNLRPPGPIMKRNHRAFGLALGFILTQGLAGCASDSPAPAALDEAALGAVAEQYVKLVLALGVHDPNYVDAYYGPEEWRTAAQADALPWEAIAARGASFAGAVAARPQSAPGGALLALRRTYLATRLRALGARARMLGGGRLSFDDDARA